MTKVEELVRADLFAIEGYPVKPRPCESIWLDMNELPWDLYVENSDTNLNRYPIVSEELICKIANNYGVKPSQVLLTRGSDDAIDLLIRLFCTPFQDNILICPPTFSMYALSAKIQGVATCTAPLENKSNFTIDIKKIIENINPKTKILFLCSPNNPTGTSIPPQEMLALLCALQEKVIVVVDEAYAEFSESASNSTYLAQFPNLVVLRTFSKAFGLAGIRAGVVVANEGIISFIQKIMPPFAISQQTLRALECALAPSKKAQLKDYAKIIQQERERVLSAVQKFSFVKKSWKSEANFILLALEDAQAFLSFAKTQNLIIKNCSTLPWLDNCVRISIGTPIENEKLLQIFLKFGALC